MGLILDELRKLKAQQVYFDADIFIYGLEEISPFEEKVSFLVTIFNITSSNFPLSVHLS
jgi:hypothetical protein